MSGFIQVGVTALRDPSTGDFLPAVPLFVRTDDAAKTEAIVIDGEAIKALSAKFADYMREKRKVKK